MPDTFAGIKDKDLAKFARDLAASGYEVRHMGTDHFQAFWKGEYTKCRIPLTPRGPGAYTRCKAAIKRFERAKGMHVMFGEQVKSERPKKPKRLTGDRRVFIMPEPGDVSDKRPASIAPSQYTVATMLGAEAMMKLASVVAPRVPVVPREVTQEMTQKPRRTWTMAEKAEILARYRKAVKEQKGEALLRELGIYNSHITSFTHQLENWNKPEEAPAAVTPVKQPGQTREWSEEEMAAIVFRYRRATQAWRDWKATGYVGDKPQTGIGLLKELGVGNGHITWFTKKLLETGRYPELGQTREQAEGPVIETVPAEEVVRWEDPPQAKPVVVSEPSFDPDEEISELTARWTELVSRRRELAARSADLNTRINDLLAQAETLDADRAKVVAEAADIAAGITKVRKRLAEVAGGE